MSLLLDHAGKIHITLVCLTRLMRKLGRVTIRSDEVQLTDVFHEIGDKIRYLYDMGDNWEHDIELRGIVREDTITKYPICPSGYGACPPEDVAGIPGFLELLRALREKDKAVLKESDLCLSKRFGREVFQSPLP